MRKRDAGLAVVATLLWGMNFVAAKLALAELPPLLLLGVRFVLVAGCMLPLYGWAKVSHLQALVLSSLLGVLHFGLMFASIWLGLDLPSAIIATQLGVVFSCILSSVLFADYIGPARSLGMLIAFLGVILVAGRPEVASNVLPFLVACVSAFCWALANIVMKRKGVVEIGPLLAYLALYAAPQLLILSYLLEGPPFAMLAIASWQAWSAIAFTAVGSTVMAYGVWYWLLGHYPVSQVAPFSLLIPAFGLGANWIYFGDEPTSQFIAGCTITMLGVTVIVLRAPQNTR